MSDHRATPADWENLRTSAALCKSTGYYALRCILELQSRIEQLEEDAIDHSDSNVFCFNAMVKRIEVLEQRPIAGIVELAAPAPAGGLVERVTQSIIAEGNRIHSWEDEARAAILAVADVMESHNWPAACWLREEVERG